ncbi:putative inorganic carbon transporter subunit DabA, partial [Leptospirillum ferriphilum]
NLHFGSGNKVLHNVVGGSIGVLEGNGGDLRTGLAMQSIHDGHRWIHEPLRLNVVLEAPEEAIDDVIGRHPLVQNLIENEWVFFFRIGEDQRIYQRKKDRTWEKRCPDGQ